MTQLAGWGRTPLHETTIVRPHDVESVRRLMTGEGGLIARGNGRAYGDAAIGRGATMTMTALDRFRSFDPDGRQVTVEGGVLIADIIASLLPRGFFPMVVPGTRFVTVGGAIAADVHGKNHHHEGGFGDAVESLGLVTPDGALVRASRTEQPDLFLATIGGMGLTGAIVEATLRLRPVATGWMVCRTRAAGSLPEMLEALKATDAATYSVAWVDATARGPALGRGLVFTGEHAETRLLEGNAASDPMPKLHPPRLAVPLDLPVSALNRRTAKAFNALYRWAGERDAASPRVIPAARFFFPLDNIAHWNRLYGRRGFVQHQCVLPFMTADAALADILERVAARGDASFLAVLKRLREADGLLSFPMPGLTLALDFAMRPDLPAFLDDLDRIVTANGGRLYLAKDAHQSRATFEAGYPNAERFRALRRTIDPQNRLRSVLSERLGL